MFNAIRYFSKYNTIILFAGMMTFALFYGMQLMILSDDTIPERKPPIKLGNVTMPEWEPDVLHKTPKPEEIEDPPAVPDIEPRVIPDDQVIATGWTKGPTLDPGELEPFPGLGPMDGNAMPIAQIQPVYPTRAQERGIEGYVIVQFDVNETGSVINPDVLVSVPEGVFDRAALRAIERWRYQPKVENGKAMKMYGLQTKFNFNLRGSAD